MLETDGGWLTAEGIALELGDGIVAVQVSDALYDKIYDRVERRTIGLASGAARGPSGFEERAEWRVKP